MSSINTRIAQLERRLGSRCPTCAHSHTRIELIGPPQQGRQADPEPCPECGQAGDLIVMGLSFDPNTDHPQTPARPGSRAMSAIAKHKPAARRPPARPRTDTARDTTSWRRPDELKIHPQADKLIPPLPREHRRAFQADIDRRGITTPLEVTSDGVVLDGRERLQAARELGQTEVPVLVVDPADPVEHILLAALQRRHLTASQRAALALELDGYRELKTSAQKRRLNNLRQSPEGAGLPPRGKTRDHVASWAGVSPRTVQDASTVQRHDPDLFQRIKAGRLAADLAARRVRRRLRDAKLPPVPPLPHGPFELIYADPPWQLGNPDGLNAPENHYPTMPLTKIKSLAPPAAKNAVLFLWAVNCLLPEALEVIEAWCFTYKTNFVWVKETIGLGNWARNRHELLLFATRGQIAVPDPDQRPDSVIEAPRLRHSQKPEDVYRLIEAAYPHLSKLELFARGALRRGWQAWGNETTGG